MKQQEFPAQPSEYAAECYKRGVAWCRTHGVPADFLRVLVDGEQGRFILRPDGWHHFPSLRGTLRTVSVVFPTDEAMRQAGLRRREWFIEYLD